MLGKNSGICSDNEVAAVMSDSIEGTASHAQTSLRDCLEMLICSPYS